MGKYNNTVAFLEQNRWPTQDSENLYYELNTTKKPVNRPAKRIKQPEFPMPLLDEVPPALLDRILTCASLKLKRVRRYPGWILQRTYNLKQRPVDFT